MLQNVTPVDSGAVSCYHDRHNWPLRGMGQLIFLDCPEFRGDIRSSESRHVKGCPLGRHVGLPEYEKCPLTPSTSSTAPCAPGSKPSSPPPRDPSSSAGPPSRAANPPSSSPPPAPAKPLPPSCGASIASCSRPSRRALSAAASSTFPPLRPSPSISNATSAPRWSASPRPPSPRASRFTSPPSPFAPGTPPPVTAPVSPAIPPTF